MIRHLRNWPEVWGRYRGGRPIERLEFRSGARVVGAGRDDLWQTFLELWILRIYDTHYEVRTGDLVIDLGANFGGLALSAMGRGQRPDMLCCEPSPRTAASLRENLRQSGLDRVHVLEVAAGKTRQTAPFYFGEKSVLDGLILSGEPSANATMVPVWPLADVIAEAYRKFPGNRPVALLKMDIEGGEVDVLEGVQPGDLDRVQRVALEFHDPLVPRARARCEAVLRKAGFSITAPPPEVSQGILFAQRGGA